MNRAMENGSNQENVILWALDDGLN